MQNKFGLKDFIFLVLLLAIGLSIWLKMVQRDRLWEQVLEVNQRVSELGQNLARLENKIDNGISVSGLSADMFRGAENHASARPAERDASWARPGIPIAWQEPWTFATDPRSQPDFQLGGEFTELFEGQPAKIVPYLSSDVYGRRVIDRVVESLGTYDPKSLEFRGLLADAWQMDPNAMWVRVHINPRARFSDGTPVTAEDVRWTFEDYILNPLIEAERARSTLDHIAGVEVIDPQTVEFTFREPVFTNLDYTLGAYVLPKHFYSQFEPSQINKSTGLLMGSGPYKLQALNPDRQWTPGEDIVLERNELYWGDKSPLARMRFKVVNDELARLTAYEAGEGDMMLPSSVQLLRKQGDPEWEREHQSPVWINMRSGYAFLAWQCGERNGELTPFHDPRVRRAMTMALDRERMVRDIWGGVGKVATGPSNSESPAHNPNIEPWPYDLDAAKALLAEAGWKPDANGVLRNADGKRFEFEFTRSSGGEVAERISSYIKDQCAKIGITCNVRVVDWSVYSQILKNRDFDAIIMSWSASAPESDPKQIWHSKSIQNQGDNFIQWRSAEGDRLIEAGRGELDPAKRHAIWHQFEALLHEEQPYTFVREVPWYRFVRRTIGNVHPYRSGIEPWEFYRRSGASVASDVN